MTCNPGEVFKHVGVLYGVSPHISASTEDALQHANAFNHVQAPDRLSQKPPAVIPHQVSHSTTNCFEDLVLYGLLCLVLLFCRIILYLLNILTFFRYLYLLYSKISVE